MSAIKKWALALAIAIVLNLFVNYGISVFYKAPQYNDFCTGQGPYREPYYPAKPYPDFTQQNCTPIAVSEQMQKSCNEQKGYIAYKYNSTGCPTEAYCETCQVQFDAVNQKYSRNIFFITAVIGIIAIIVGLVYVHLDPIASGFMFGGIFVLIYGTIRVFGNLSKVMRVVVLGIELVVLVYIGIKTITRGKRKEK